MTPVVVDSTNADATPTAFLDALHRLQQHGISQLYLRGGEPTQHPDFAWMLTRALERGFSLLVHSSGLIPHAVVRKLERLPPEQVALICPAVIPGEVWPHQLTQQFHLFTRLGPRIVPAINLLFPSVKLDFVLDWIDQYHLARRVIVELRPLIEDETLELAQLINDFTRRALLRRIRLELDRENRPGLDLLPDGRVVPRGFLSSTATPTS